MLLDCGEFFTFKSIHLTVQTSRIFTSFFFVFHGVTLDPSERMYLHGDLFLH